jgi:hypothetical protein
MAKEQDSFGKRLKRLFPTVSEKDALANLIKIHRDFRSTAKAMNVSLATISRWAYRLGVSEPPPFPHFRVLRELAKIPGKSNADKLGKMISEEGTWIRVAVRLNVTVRELKVYRKSIGILPRSPWKERCDIRTLLDEGDKSNDEGYFGF